MSDVPLILNDTFQVPLYQLSKNFKNSQKLQEQNANTSLKALKDLLQRVSIKEKAGEEVAPDKIIAALDKIANKLVEIRDQATKNSNEMQSTLVSLTFRCAMRDGSHTQIHESRDSKRARSMNNNESAGNKKSSTDVETNLEISMIGNYLLRTNRYLTFKSLCQESDCSFLSQDVETFQSQNEIYVDLTENHNADPALTWCSENRSTLKKRNSSFEFDLRLRQFCDIVENGDAKEAVNYSRKYLSQNANDDKMRKAMATLAFPKGTLSETPYKHLVSNESWTKLGEAFLKERAEILNLNKISPLEMVIRCGLAVTRTQSCKPDGVGRQAGCPSCQPSLGKLALKIPRTMRERSTLVCRISGEEMDDVLILPNGQAYSRVALEAMTQERKDGKVLCPITHQEFYFRDLKRAFVL